MRHNSAQIPTKRVGLASLLIASACLAACGEAHSGSPSGSGDAAAILGTAGTAGQLSPFTAGGSPAPAVCNRAAGLDRASRDSCSSAAAYLMCQYPGGVSALCLTDASTCEAIDLAGAPSSCQNQCQPNEYAVTCGYPGPNPGNARPPEGCKPLAPTPAGPLSYCCPCL